MSLSQSLGLYTLPVLVEIVMQVCPSFCRMWDGLVWALQCIVATCVDLSCSRAYFSNSLYSAHEYFNYCILNTSCTNERDFISAPT